MSTYLTAIAMSAGLVLATACSERGSQSTGEALPAPVGSTDAARTVEPEEEPEDSTFAALDADSNGTLDENEWQSEEARNTANLKNMSFAQIDRNESGGIEPDEFDSARTGGGAELNAARDPTVRDSDADTTDATGG